LSEPDIEVVVAEDALERLVAYAQRERWTQPVVVCDQNTLEAAGRAVVEALSEAGIDSPTLVFPEREGLLAGDEQVARVHACGHQPLIAVGSGVITDIVRRTADISDVDFVSIPTAASMDGYASSVAAMQIDGVKVTFPARAPKAIFADPRVAAVAPSELTKAGIGDLLAKATARVDWLAAHVLYGEEFREDVAERVLEPLSFAAGNAARLLDGDPEAIRLLLEGLIQSGIAMAINGNSRPASGCEHHASHFWDLLAARGLRPHHSHGLQVGYAARFAMRLQRYAFDRGLTRLKRPAPVADPLGPAAREWLGDPLPQDIVDAVQEKQRYAADVPADWPQELDAVRARLADSLALFDEAEAALALAGIPSEPGYLDVDARTLNATFRYASRLRARYTTIDFLEGQEALEDALEAAGIGA
jgi:glycerol-1-phosphate dehydrogenase [NAD(P)+]